MLVDAFDLKAQALIEWAYRERFRAVEICDFKLALVGMKPSFPKSGWLQIKEIPSYHKI